MMNRPSDQPKLPYGSNPILYAGDSDQDYVAVDYLRQKRIAYRLGAEIISEKTPLLTSGGYSYYGLDGIKLFVEKAGQQANCVKPSPTLDLPETQGLADWLGADLYVVAEALGISDAVIRQWTRGVPVRATVGASWDQLDSLVALKVLLDRAVESEQTRIEWLRESNELLDSRTPLEAIRAGEAGDVYSLVLAVAEGTYF